MQYLSTKERLFEILIKLPVKVYVYLLNSKGKLYSTLPSVCSMASNIQAIVSNMQTSVSKTYSTLPATDFLCYKIKSHAEVPSEPILFIFNIPG